MTLQWKVIINQDKLYINNQRQMSRLNSIRDHYQQLRNYAMNNEMKKANYKEIGRYKDEAQKEVERMTQANSFENLQQVDFYRDKFAMLESAMANASKNKMSMKDFTLQAKQILKQKGFESRNSYLSQPPVDPKVTSEPQAQNKILQSFFDQKRSKVVPQVGFRSLLQNPPVSSKTFKKRIGVNNEEISRLRSQNHQLRSRLETSKLGVGVGSGNLQAEIRRQQERIIYLQSQNDRLSRDNTKLKSQRSVTVYTGSQNNDDYLYSPYVINPRENDLMKIGLRTSDYDYSNLNYNQNNQVHYEREVYGNFPSFNSKSQSQFKAGFKQTMSQMGDYENNKQRYSIFDMSKSHFSEVGGSENNFVTNGSSGIQDSRTAAKNKMAFFRSSGLIVKDNDIEIAFKRTQNANLDSNRIILYFNNKLNQGRRINVNYEYENQYYDLNVAQKISEVGPLKQGRQVVEVRLRNNEDLNSIIEANVDVDGKRYKLWLPAMFIRFQRPRQGMMQSRDAVKKVVFPCKLFSSQIQAEKAIQMMEIQGRGESCVWGESPVYNGPIKMVWRQGNKLQVTTSSRWIDFITFIMFDYR